MFKLLQHAWDGLSATMADADPDNTSFFRNIVRLMLTLVASNFRRRELPSFLSFKGHEDKDAISLDTTTDSFKNLDYTDGQSIHPSTLIMSTTI